MIKKYLIAIAAIAVAGCTSDTKDAASKTGNTDTTASDTQEQQHKPSRFNAYALSDSIQHDKQYHVRGVVFQEGVLKVTVDTPGKDAAKYFAQRYTIDSFKDVKRLEVYKNVSVTVNPSTRKPVSIVDKVQPGTK